MAEKATLPLNTQYAALFRLWLFAAQCFTWDLGKLSPVQFGQKWLTLETRLHRPHFGNSAVLPQHDENRGQRSDEWNLMKGCCENPKGFFRRRPRSPFHCSQNLCELAPLPKPTSPIFSSTRFGGVVEICFFQLAGKIKVEYRGHPLNQQPPKHLNAGPGLISASATVPGFSY